MADFEIGDRVVYRGTHPSVRAERLEGEEGTVSDVTTTGSVHVKWDNGDSQGQIPGTPNGYFAQNLRRTAPRFNEGDRVQYNATLASADDSLNGILGTVLRAHSSNPLNGDNTVFSYNVEWDYSDTHRTRPCEENLIRVSEASGSESEPAKTTHEVFNEYVEKLDDMITSGTYAGKMSAIGFLYQFAHDMKEAGNEG